MKICKVCGKPNSEKHHIVFRSQQKALEHYQYNIMYLCSEHHRGNNSPHKSRQIDIRYKLQFQKKLFKLFTKEEYTEKEIKEILDISNAAVRRIVKTISRYVDKYKQEDIIRSCMGGRLYG
ncbi:hypothetical protein DP134_14030 [Clostridium tetani]|uniref:hypothetical protein n=1 Tax=Clostridium tetani TaxID=1513 RepID=UPI00100BE8A2|nr:hypothetical protein [Clostridium tetani]RXM53923.1 hypothetical protein DP134_14030 [Clostridium tetani]